MADNNGLTRVILSRYGGRCGSLAVGIRRLVIPRVIVSEAQGYRQEDESGGEADPEQHEVTHRANAEESQRR